MKSIFPHKKSTQAGQSFVEFVLLMSVLSLLSIGVLSGFNTGIGDAWLKIVKNVGGPIPGSPANVNLR